MKKIIIILSIIILGGIVSFTTLNNNPKETTEQSIVTCKYDQCHATAKSTGKRCKHCVSKKGDKYCWQHRNK